MHLFHRDHIKSHFPDITLIFATSSTPVNSWSVPSLALIHDPFIFRSVNSWSVNSWSIPFLFMIRSFPVLFSIHRLFLSSACPEVPFSSLNYYISHPFCQAFLIHPCYFSIWTAYIPLALILPSLSNSPPLSIITLSNKCPSSSLCISLSLLHLTLLSLLTSTYVSLLSSRIYKICFPLSCTLTFAPHSFPLSVLYNCDWQALRINGFLIFCS